VAVQRSPVRYLQRPDRAGQRLDTTRTTLAGGAGEVRLGYEGRRGAAARHDGARDVADVRAERPRATSPAPTSGRW
jgi:hypothetical protein